MTFAQWLIYNSAKMSHPGDGISAVEREGVVYITRSRNNEVLQQVEVASNGHLKHTYYKED